MAHATFLDKNQLKSLEALYSRQLEARSRGGAFGYAVASSVCARLLEEEEEEELF
jgi:hypothetical protein